MVSEDGRREYRGLLVDYGGVLTTSPFGSFADFCAQEGLAQETVARSLRTDPRCRQLLIALETGRLPEAEFEAGLASILGVTAPNLIARMFAGSRPDTKMAAAIRGARRAGVRTALVSNSWGTGTYDRALLNELFEAVVISGEVGVRKPAPQIYKLAAERIDVAPQACVFIDDLPFNLPPARELGMATIHHVSTEQTITEMSRLLSGVTSEDLAGRMTHSGEAQRASGGRQDRR
ncbi:MAG TPA: HAD family phosphatase [Solirubrobacteraceae bacterium]|nr:HAD family phosphatase [Solirubrobacteraceae bacterium]